MEKHSPHRLGLAFRPWASPIVGTAVILRVMETATHAARSLGFCVLLAAITVLPASAKESAPKRSLVISSVAVSNLTGDPLIVPTLADSLFRRVMSLDAFGGDEPASGGQGLTSEYFAIPNPFRVAPGSSADSTTIFVQLELEQCYYGPVIDPKSDIVTFWAFGILGTALSKQRPTMGMVQWRATIHKPGADAPVISIGQGVCIGYPETLGRRNALLTADKRAFYRLAYEMAQAVDDGYSLHLGKLGPLTFP